MRFRHILSRLKSLNQTRKNEGFRLRTETEWQYAVSALGSSYQYAESHRPKKVGWSSENSFSKSHSSSLKLPNGLGLFDVSGNLSEWCHDWFGGNFPFNSMKDLNGPKEGHYRVHRGGN